MKRLRLKIAAMTMATVMMFMAIPLQAEGFVNLHNELQMDNVLSYNADSGIFEQFDEFNGSLFHFVLTNDFVYSSQLSPEGVYSFAFRFLHDEGRLPLLKCQNLLTK
ncbi:MAG: hypothetical protein FWE21_03040 [Defluviitaleaceae bacterium]|nr:hypothetical protein [Defluviitaleaceae bacterium]